jgi:4-amino-4-deoxy-L-arabinose transferase-like glycosyltransferase
VRKPEHLLFWVTCTVVAISALLRCYKLGTIPGLNPDEVEITLQWFGERPIYWYIAPSGRPHINPLAPVLLFPFVMLAHPAPWVVRMPALLAGLALLPVTFFVVSKAFDRLTAVIATVLVSSLPLHIAYSRLGWDPAYVPLVTTLALGFALQRRWGWAIFFTLLLALIHPISLFVAPIVAGPAMWQLWSNTSDSSHEKLKRISLILVAVTAYAMMVLLALATSRDVPREAKNLTGLFGLIGERLGDLQGLSQYFSGYWHALEGTLIYSGFVGGNPPIPTMWSVPLLACLFAGGAYFLWRQRKVTEAILLISLPIALTAQYLTQGQGATEVLRERYILWATVPSCLAGAVLLNGVCVRLGAAKYAPIVASALSVFWLSSFYMFYLRPFEANGGISPVLDYRLAKAPGKEQVIEIIKNQRQYPEKKSIVFVGETRLHLVLVYLASKDKYLDVKNLGEVEYPHYQKYDEPDLWESYGQYTDGPQDIFFVDYAWDEGLPGDVVWFIPHPTGKSLDKVTAPWKADKLQTVCTPNGGPLITIWRLSRPI